jgi:hypothetical protein
MYDEYHQNAHPAITRRNEPMSPRFGAKGPSTAPGGIDPAGLGSAGSQSILEEDLRQSNPYYLDYGAPGQSAQNGISTFNRAVNRRFGRPINPAEMLARTNPTNPNFTKAAPPPVSNVTVAQKALGRLNVKYDGNVREVPSQRLRIAGMEVQNQLQYDHLVKKAYQVNRLEELQKARHLRLKAANHEKIAAIAEVAPDHVADALYGGNLVDVSGRPTGVGLPPTWLLMTFIVGAATAMFVATAFMNKGRR